MLSVSLGYQLQFDQYAGFHQEPVNLSLPCFDKEFHAVPPGVLSWRETRGYHKILRKLLHGTGVVCENERRWFE